MKIHYILIFFFAISACKQSNIKLIEQRKAWGFENWESDFKDRACFLCLLEAYENDQIKKHLLRNDKSFNTGIVTAFFDPVLKPLVLKEIAKIKQDSIESFEKVPEYMVGKRVFRHCMKFYKSDRLNSILQLEKQKWDKLEDIEAEVLKCSPSF